MKIVWGFAAVTVLAASAVVAIVAPSAAYAQPEDCAGFEYPEDYAPGWEEWNRLHNSESDDDLDSDLSVLTGQEWDAMDEGQRDEFFAWLQDARDEHGDDNVREWLDCGVAARIMREIDFPEDGVVDQVEEGVENEVGEEVEDVREAGEAAGEAVSEAASDVANAAFDGAARRINEAAADFTGYIGTELARTGRPQLDADWYRLHYQRMLGWAGLLLLPLALLAVGSAVVRGDTARVGHVLMQVPIAYLMGVLAISAVSASSGLASAMARSLVPGMQDSSQDIAARITELDEGGLGWGVLLLLGLLMALAALVTLIWLLLAEASIYAVVLFVPFAFAGRVWDPARDWGRKLLTTAFSLVAAKVVIAAVWALTVDGLAAASAGDAPLRSGLAIGALLLVTAISPAATLRLIPMMEAAGVTPSAGRAAQQAMSTGYYTGRMARMAGIGGGGRGSARGRAGGSGGGLGVSSNVAGAAARVPAGAGNGGGTGGTGPSPLRTQPSTEGSAKASGPTGGGQGESGAGQSHRPHGTPQQPGTRPGEPEGWSGWSRSDQQPRVAPPAPPPGTTDGRPWRKHE